VECSTHPGCFTLYPSGHVPYGRERVAPVAPDGQPLKVSPAATARAASAGAAAPPGPAAAEGATEARWRQTGFAAVIDAAQGKAWAQEPPGPYATTQLDRMDELAALLGLAERSASRLELTSRHLGVPELTLRDAARGYQASLGSQERGLSLLAVLRQVRPGRTVLERILACGAAVGLWGTVHFWCVPGVRGGTPSRRLLPGLGLPDG